MLHLALEILLLVFATAFVGLATGFGAGKVHGAMRRPGPDQAVDDTAFSDANDEDIDAERPQGRRIPDPAPPSELRKKRLLKDPSAKQS